MMLLVIIFATVFLIGVGILRFRRSPSNYMSFRESLALAELPVVTFYQGEHKINCVLDTGANISVLDLEAAKPLEIEPTGEYSEYVGIHGNPRKAMIVSVPFTYKDKSFTERFQVMDMSATFSKIKEVTGVTVHGMIGNAFMQKYKYILDFKEMVAYTK